MIARVLAKTGATVRDHEMMYKAVSQSVIMYSSESWVVTGANLKVLEMFHHRADRCITGMTERCEAGGKWEYPPVVTALKSAGLHPIMEYIIRRQENIVENVACRPSCELYVEAERRLGTSRRMRWLGQDVVNEPKD